MTKAILFYRNSLLTKLFMLVILLVGGGNSAWADDVTESFEYATDGTTEISINSGNMSLTNGWCVIGTGGIGTTYAVTYSLRLNSYQGNSRTGKYSIYGTEANTANWIVCPIQVNGTLSFYARRGGTSGYIKVGIATKTNDVFSISNDNVQTTSFNSDDYKNKFSEISVNLGSSPVYVAFLVNYGYIDDVTYTPYEETPAEATLSISPDEDVEFGTVWANAIKTDYYTITNNSESSVNVVAAISGTDAASFSVSPSEAQDIAAGETQTYSISYTYDPSSLGEKSATITFTPDEDGTNAITKNISVTAVSNFNISSTDGAFGDVTADANKVYTITNHTGSTVTVTPSVSGTNAEMFSVSPDEDTEIADGESQNFTVSFDWQADVAKLGEKTATITFTPNNGKDPFVISAIATAKTQAVFDENEVPSYTSGIKSLLIKYTPSNNWNTLCLPIYIGSAIFSSYMTAIFGSDCKAYQLDSYSDNTLRFSKVTSISSATPYLVYVPTAASHEDGVVFESVYIYSTAAGSVTKGDATFQGSYAPITAGNFTSSMYGVTSSGQVRPGDGEYANMKGYRAYFTGVSAPAGARVSIVIEGDDGTTDLGFVKMVDENAKDIYTLSGQKVQKGGKGIYIVNGRKVVIK